jgi:hypothetical protein
MKGFKNTPRTRSGFHFGKNAGFTVSSGRVQNISYSRKTPQRRAKFAEGGRIDSSLVSFKGDSQLNVEHGPKGGLRPGFAGGGVPHYAKGGRIPPEKVAAREARAAVAKHVASPAPRGHKGLKSC